MFVVYERQSCYYQVTEYVMCISDQRESINIDRFMRETGERWKNVSMELRCVQSMLEEVVAYWRRWNTVADEFESWLDRAYGMLDLPEEDKMEYFQVIYQYTRVKQEVHKHRKEIFMYLSKYLTKLVCVYLDLMINHYFIPVTQLLVF
jgi:hypothetical protein